jgi:anaerobic C4-dicarboxylate transporter
METTIEIQKKSRPVVLVFAIIFLLAVVAVAIWGLTGFIFPKLEGFWDLKITAIVIVIALPIWAIYLIIQQSSKTKPGLTISKDGITDFSNITSVGFVPWSDITAIKEEKNEFKQKLIVIIVKNPDAYINKPSRMRASRQAQHIQFGSPIVISASTLEYDPQELVSILKDRVEIAARRA